MDQVTLEYDGGEFVVRFSGREGRYQTIVAALDQARKWLELQQAVLDDRISAPAWVSR